MVSILIGQWVDTPHMTDLVVAIWERSTPLSMVLPTMTLNPTPLFRANIPFDIVLAAYPPQSSLSLAESFGAWPKVSMSAMTF